MTRLSLKKEIIKNGGIFKSTRVFTYKNQEYYLDMFIKRYGFGKSWGMFTPRLMLKQQIKSVTKVNKNRSLWHDFINAIDLLVIAIIFVWGFFSHVFYPIVSKLCQYEDFDKGLSRSQKAYELFEKNKENQSLQGFGKKTKLLTICHGLSIDSNCGDNYY